MAEQERDAQGFLYPLGATLTHRAELTSPRSLLRLFVVCRMTQECPGGTQRHYECRAVRSGELLGLVQCNETELCHLPL